MRKLADLYEICTQISSDAYHQINIMHKHFCNFHIRALHFVHSTPTVTCIAWPADFGHHDENLNLLGECLSPRRLEVGNAIRSHVNQFNLRVGSP